MPSKSMAMRTRPSSGSSFAGAWSTSRPRSTPRRATRSPCRVSALCPAGGLLVETRPKGREDRVSRGVLLAVGEVERVIEVRRILTLGVLENRLQLVESFGQSRLRRAGLLVFIPQGEDLDLHRGRERRNQLQQIS